MEAEWCHVKNIGCHLLFLTSKGRATAQGLVGELSLPNVVERPAQGLAYLMALPHPLIPKK